MRAIRWFPFAMVALVVASCQREAHDGPPGWELKPLAPAAQPVAATRQLQGIYPAGSHLPDKKAIGGFGPCDNYPFDLGDKDWGAKGAVSLVAFPEESVAYFKHRGMALRLVNRTGRVESFSATDSYLLIVQEALDANGRWQPIEFNFEPRCGNSYHRVFLKPGEFWQFPARQYTGLIQTRLRFRLTQSEGQILYSNEFDGAISNAQFKAAAEEG